MISPPSPAPPSPSPPSSTTTSSLPPAPISPAATSSAWSCAWGLASAAAASIALILWLNPLHHPAPSTPVATTIPTPVATADLNGDGQVDILDALLLAKRLQAASLTDLRLDINHDGIIDDRDVQSLAQTAVSLTPNTTPSKTPIQ